MNGVHGSGSINSSQRTQLIIIQTDIAYGNGRYISVGSTNLTNM